MDREVRYAFDKKTGAPQTDTLLIPFDLILIAKANPHIDWNEQMAYAVKFYDEHRDEIMSKE